MNAPSPSIRLKELLDAIVRKHYNEIADPTGVDGAQMWNGKWWMPLWGCDTLQTMLEDFEYTLRASNAALSRAGHGHNRKRCAVSPRRPRTRS